VKCWRYKVNVTPAEMERGGGDLAGFLDMMRYDQARVITWDRDGKGLVIELQSDRPPTEDRWKSFALFLKEVHEVAR
jgi:hypothetical protein